MPDRISQYRQIRLLVSPSELHHVAHWSLSTISVRKGVPHATAIDDGLLRGFGMPTTVEDVILMALAAAGEVEARNLLG